MPMILHLVDPQNDFMLPGYALSVAGAERLIKPTNAFFAEVPQGAFRFALATYDTHFVGEYPLSPESEYFPNIHCSYGTDGWSLTVNLRALPNNLPIYYMTKNVFDMWGSNPTGVDPQNIAFSSPQERQAYQNLFHVTDDPLGLKPGTPRDSWLDQQGIGPDTTVVVVGVASDYCVLDALKGYAARGCKMIVLSDLMQGIGGNPERSLSGMIEDVCAQHFAAQMASGRLLVMSSRAFIDQLPAPQQELPAPAKPPAIQQIPSHP